ncbi:MAG: glucose-6-phosphate dehydrogenase assembly protein OpcA [Verrucomicrobiales bacterium]
MTASADVDNAFLGQEVDVPEIDEALRQLWASSDAVTKASLINFAIYNENAASLDENTRLIAEVTREHACRAILIAAEPAKGETSVRAWITAHCQLSGSGGKSVCSEQITFLLRGHIRNLLRNLVFAHLESDLPLVFFWQGDFSERWEPHLYRHIDRLVIDSGEWSDATTQLGKLRAAWKDSVSHFVVLDLVWLRVFSFRLALAGAFDEAMARAHLDAINRLEIAFAPGHRVAACLMAAWVACKAGWPLSRLDVSLREEPGAPLSRLELSSAGARVILRREEGGQFVHSRIEAGAVTLEQVMPALSNDCARLVTERLSRGGNNMLYFKLWRAARTLL